MTDRYDLTGAFDGLSLRSESNKDVMIRELQPIFKDIRPVRANITKANTAFEQVMILNPDSTNFGPLEFSKIAVMNMRVHELHQNLVSLTAKIESEMNSQVFTYDEIDKEHDKAVHYNDLAQTMIHYFHIVDQDRDQKIQMELNSSLNPSPVTAAPFGPSSSSTPIPHRVTTKFTGVKTPTIELPTFSGDYLMWPSFIDRFNGMIDKNETFSPVHKLEYLKMCVKGEPARMIQNLLSIDDNYAIAMDMLSCRYLDELPLIAKYVENLLNFKPLTQKSAKDLRRLHETFLLNTQGLRNIGYPFDTYIMVFMCATKLDPETRELWERKTVELPRTNGRQTVPVAEQMFTFIDQCARTLEHTLHVKLDKNSNPSKKASGSFVTTEEVFSNYAGNSYSRQQKPPKNLQKPRPEPRVPPPPKAEPKVDMACSACGADHKLWNCDKFKALPMDDKKSTVYRAKLCFNCLGFGHQTRACTSKFSCKTCKSRHHTLMHAPVTPAGS